MMNEIQFADIHWLWGWLAVALLIFYYLIWKKEKLYPSFKVSTTEGPRNHGSRWKIIFSRIMLTSRILCLGLLFTAMARPQLPDSEKKVETEGIDIVLAVDVSPSMLAMDFKPDRLRASKETAKKFIAERKNDRIGLVLFAGEAFTQCPITIDHEILQRQMDESRVGVLDPGTAIGSGLGTAVNRLKESQSASKVIILLTDGVNNAGNTDPLMAAELAATYNIRVHTIGVGTRGKARSPISIQPNGQYNYGLVPVEIDEELLKKIAAKTGGNYYRATDNNALAKIYTDINRLERSKVLVSSLPKHHELYPFWLWIAAAFLFFDFLLRITLLKSPVA